MGRKKIYIIVAIIVLIVSVGLIGFSIYIINQNKTYHTISDLPVVDSVLTDIQFNDMTFNFGDIKEDTMVKVSYIIKNIGNENLKIHFVKPDCNCTDFYLSKREVLPSDTARIDLTIDTKDKIGAQVLNTTMLANTKARMYKLVVKMNVLKNIGDE